MNEPHKIKFVKLANDFIDNTRWVREQERKAILKLERQRIKDNALSYEVVKIDCEQAHLEDVYHPLGHEVKIYRVLETTLED